MKPMIKRTPRWAVGLWAPVLAALLAACATSTPAPEPTALPASEPEPSDSWAREDRQGAVTVVVTPLNLGEESATLDFEVSLNTHSVDLSMDLTQLAVLRTDTGLEVRPLSWPVGSGHHLQGVLSFPAQTAEGRDLLEGAMKLTLVLRDVDVPERVFRWDVPG